MTTAEKLTAIAENQEKVYEAGRASEYDRFWDAYQTNGAAANYAYAFSGRGWNGDTYHPKYPLDTGMITNAAAMYLWSAVSEIGCINLENATSFIQIFAGAQLLTTIEGIKFPPEDMPNGTFELCSKLENIVVQNTIVGNVNFQYCPLTKDSILSVVGALSTEVTGKTVTFKKNAVNAAFTTEEWNALKAMKPNWTIAVV